MPITAPKLTKKDTKIGQYRRRINATDNIQFLYMRPPFWLMEIRILYQNQINASLGAARHEADTDSRDVFTSIKP